LVLKMADSKTLYTDVFTGAPISSQIPYQSIDLAVTSNAQLIWPAQSISVSNNSASTNYYVGQITDIVSINTIPSILTLYLPDIKQMPKGSAFTIVNKTANSQTINVLRYDGTFYFRMGSPTAYTFYITDNTIQSGWTLPSPINYLLPYNKGDFTTAQNILLVWANQTLPALGAYASCFFDVIDTAPWHAQDITLPNAMLAPVGTSFTIALRVVGTNKTYNIKDFAANILTTITSGSPSFTFYIKDNTVNNGFVTWGVVGNMTTVG
jgi:hypothetical protein